MNFITYTNERAEELRNEGVPFMGGAIAQKIHAEVTTNHPIYLGIINEVRYVEATDKYVARADKNTMKVRDDVAAFLLEHCFKTASPIVYAAMIDGVIVSVHLQFVDRC